MSRQGSPAPTAALLSPSRGYVATTSVKDALVLTGKAQNPPQTRTGEHGRPALGKAGSLLSRLHTHRADVLRFATEFHGLLDDNQAKRDAPMVKLQR